MKNEKIYCSRGKDIKGNDMLVEKIYVSKYSTKKQKIGMIVSERKLRGMK